ncbi:hypothetical protein J4480_06450 [Candidatus Woesearchaeota archaeon]|nr:hypothetical protein [Candidatus Woesearchaeota archaeon]
MTETLDIPRRDSYVVFPGRNTEQMPLLIEKGRTPMTMYEFARQKLLIRKLYNDVSKNPDNYPEEFRQKVAEKNVQLWDRYADAGDLWLRQSANQERKGKVVLYNEQVLDFLKKNLNPRSRLTNQGALALDRELEGAYDSFTGDNVLELSKANIDRFFGKSNTRQEAKDSPFWRFVLRDLTNDYADAVFTDGKQKFNYDSAMGIYVADPENVQTMRLWCVNGLGDGSDAWGRLVYYFGRLVGVVPEARNAPKATPQTLEQRV